MSSIVAIIIAVQIHDLYLAQIMVLPGCDLVQGFFCVTTGCVLFSADSEDSV